MNRNGPLTLIRLIFHCLSLHRKSKDKLLDLNLNVNLLSASDGREILIEAGRNRRATRPARQNFKGLLEEERLDRRMKASLPLI